MSESERGPSAAQQALPAFLDVLERSSLRDGLRLVAGLTAGGVGIRELVLDLLAPAQVEVGARWATARWSVVQEHAATAIVEAALSGAVARLPTPVAEDGPPVVLACVDEEWHALAARMAAEVLRADGLPVTYLGASLPAEHLGEYLRGIEPVALLLSASMPTGLPAAREAIAASHEVGVPVLAGGSAFGIDDRRAHAIGADGWSSDVDSCRQILRDWSSRPPALVTQPPLDDEVLALLSLPAEASSAMQRDLMRRRHRMIAFNPAAGERLRKDLAWVVQHTAAALTVQDGRVLEEYGGWLRQVLTARKLPGDVVGDMFTAAADALSDELPRSKHLLRSMAGSVTQARSEPDSPDSEASRD